MKVSEIRMIMAVTLLLAVIVFTMYAGPTIGLPADTTEKLINVLPGIFVFFVGAALLAWQGVSIFSLPGFMALGIGLAVLIGEIEAFAVYPVAPAGGPTLEQVQWIIIILCALIGGALAAVSKGR